MYFRENEKSQLLGEIIIHSVSTISDVRAMISIELQIEFPYILKKCNIPLPRNIDSKRASLFFSSDDECLYIERK